MAKNNNISELDAAQVFKRTVDGVHDAIRVVQAFNTEMTVELNSDDGDSVQAVARTKVIKPEDGDVDCSDLRRVCKYGVGGIVDVSPDGVNWVVLPISNLEIKEICALKVRVSSGILVGQS